MIIGAVLAGYATYMLQQGFGTSSVSETVSFIYSIFWLIGSLDILEYCNLPNTL